MQLSEHFSLEELTVTRHVGIDNTPTRAILDNLTSILCPNAEKIRAFLAVPMVVLSGYRSPALNAAVGGSASSDHMNGLAIDFIAPQYGDPKFVATHLRDSGLKFDQLIWEYTWVHVGFGLRMRQEVMTAQFVGGKPYYYPGIT